MVLPRARVAALIQIMFALVVLAACSGGGPSGPPLPDGQGLLKQSATAMRAVKSIGFAIRAEGNPAVSVKSADGKLLGTGDAEGTLQIEQFGQKVELAFTVLGDTVYFKGATGGYQKVPKATVLALYDPTAILNADRGVAQLLTAATGPKTEAREQVAGNDTYRVRAGLSKSVVSVLVPGIAQDVTGQVWIAATDHRVLKARVPIPAAGGGGRTSGAVIVTFSDFNADFKITAPKG